MIFSLANQYHQQEQEGCREEKQLKRSERGAQQVWGKTSNLYSMLEYSKTSNSYSMLEYSTTSNSYWTKKLIRAAAATAELLPLSSFHPLCKPTSLLQAEWGSEKSLVSQKDDLFWTIQAVLFLILKAIDIPGPQWTLLKPCRQDWNQCYMDTTASTCRR